MVGNCLVTPHRAAPNEYDYHTIREFFHSQKIKDNGEGRFHFASHQRYMCLLQTGPQ